MSMSSWAERECRIACKRENPNYNFDSDEFDYGCSCYKSALKAYNSLMSDGHSGTSFGFTKNILIRLLENIPLTPITDEDFLNVEQGTEEHPAAPAEYLRDAGLKSSIQCPRLYSLFREEKLDGTITYHDNDRAYYVDVEEPSDTFHSSMSFLDEMFPITLPYVPKRDKYQIYAQTFLTDRKHGDFDTRGILYVITPKGERVDVNIFETEGDNGEWKRITKEEYDELLKKRLDPLNEKISSHLIWTLISNNGNDEIIESREKAYSKVPQEVRDEWFKQLDEMCKFFDNPENYKYNTFINHQLICNGNIEEKEDVKELKDISNFLQDILEKIKQY